MNIKKMTAVFGSLDNESLELRPGLNIITAPNESGKSTWCAFIRAMLYGIDSSQREKGGVKPDKVKYAPWSGKPMSGEMELEWEGRDISLSRSTKTASSPMKVFSARYAGTAQAIDGISGTDAGLVLTGLSRTVFDSSVFVRQAGLGVSNSAELEKRISSLVTTGDDSGGSYTAADETLRTWLRKRRHNRSGAIPSLENEILEKKQQLSAMESEVRQRGELEERLKESRRREALSAREAQQQEESDRARRVQAVSARREALAKAEKDLAEAREKLAAAKSECDRSLFAGKTVEEARKDAAGDAELLETLRKAVPGCLPLLVLGLLAAAALACASVFSLAWLYAVTGVLFMAGVILAARRNGKAKECKNFETAMLHRYGRPDPQVILAAAETYAESHHRLLSAENALRHGEEQVRYDREALHRAEEALLSSGEQAGLGGLSRAQSETAWLERQMALCEGRLEAMGDPMVVGTELRTLEEEQARLQAQYDALALAIAALKEANAELQQRFSPQLSAKAGEYMSRLTGGKYDRLTFDRELNALARRSGELESHETAFLSAGTADQLYLALRLAICTLALPEGKSCPLILDDALVNFDDERMGLALELLKDIARERQVILFTCHHREAKYLTQAGK